MSEYAPRVTTVKIPVDKIGMVIGPKGQTINAIQDETGAEISIEDDGTIYVGATNGPSAQAAVDRINAIANPTMPKVGERFLGTVVKTAAFGAFVSLLPGRDGLLHISKVGDGKRVEKVEDFLNVGDKVEVEIARHRRPRQDLPGQGAPGGRRGAGRRRRAAPAAATGRPAGTAGDRGPRDRGGDRGGTAAWPADRSAAAGWRRRRGVQAAAVPRRDERRRDAAASTEQVRSSRVRRHGRRVRVARPAAPAQPAPGPRAVTRTLSDDPLGGTVRRTVLPSGLRVLTEAIPAMRSVSFGIWVAVGSRDETGPQAGVSHFLEHLLFKGTKQADRDGHLLRRSRRWAGRPTPSPPRSTPATTRGCSTPTCRWPST